MKKSPLLVFVILFVSCGFINPAHAQWTDMVWESYGIGFKAPTDFTVSVNDEGAYTASGAVFTMSIKASDDDEDLYPMDICQNALDDTPGTDKTIIKESAIDDQNGLEGYEAYCTGIQDGKMMHMIIGGYQDPIMLTSFTVQLLYWDDPKQNDTNYEAAIYILRSLKVTDY
jgi:hypothetical protein